MIVIPMAGESKRFTSAGYAVPKYQLELLGTPVFDFAVRSFESLFQSEPFLFVLRGGPEDEAFVEHRLGTIGVANARLIRLEALTRGQAETVLFGLEAAGVNAEEPITIFNVDTFRPGFALPDMAHTSDGYLETFQAGGDHWSFVVPDPDAPTNARRVVEKERVSDHCCTGLYHFSSCAIFEDAYAKERENPSQEIGEYYVAPLYNQLIGEGMPVTFADVPSDDVILCGIPDEYESLVADPTPLNRFDR